MTGDIASSTHDSSHELGIERGIRAFPGFHTGNDFGIALGHFSEYLLTGFHVRIAGLGSGGFNFLQWRRRNFGLSCFLIALKLGDAIWEGIFVRVSIRFHNMPFDV